MPAARRPLRRPPRRRGRLDGTRCPLPAARGAARRTAVAGGMLPHYMRTGLLYSAGRATPAHLRPAREDPVPNAGAAASQHEGGGSSSSDSRFTSFTRAGFVSAIRKATQRPTSPLLHVATTQIIPVEPLRKQFIPVGPLRKKAKVIINDAVEVHSDTSESDACLEDIPQRFPKRIDYARGDQRGLDDATTDETSVDAMHALKFSQSGALSRNARGLVATQGGGAGR